MTYIRLNITSTIDMLAFVNRHWLFRWLFVGLRGVYVGLSWAYVAVVGPWWPSLAFVSQRWLFVGLRGVYVGFVSLRWPSWGLRWLREPMLAFVGSTLAS